MSPLNSTQLLLGFIAGITIFLGLPIAVLPKINDRTRSFLTAMSTGILIYLLVEIVGDVTHEAVEELIVQAPPGSPLFREALAHAGIFVIGLAAGLLGLVFFENRYIAGGKDDLVPAEQANRVALMIAIGIGLHNFSEGLAIGYQYSWGETKLALFLAVGFGLHNATEGFGIAAPLSGHHPSLKRLLGLGLIGGLPTLIGTVIGGLWELKILGILFMSFAAGCILYIIGELLHLGRRLKGEALAETGLLLGFFLAFGTEILISIAEKY